MNRLFVNLPLLSTANIPLVELILIFKDFYHLPVSLVMFTHLLIDALEYAQVGLYYTLTYFF